MTQDELLALLEEEWRKEGTQRRWLQKYGEGLAETYLSAALMRRINPGRKVLAALANALDREWISREYHYTLGPKRGQQ